MQNEQKNMLNAALFFVRVWEVELSIQRFVIQKFQKYKKNVLLKFLYQRAYTIAYSFPIHIL